MKLDGPRRYTRYVVEEHVARLTLARPEKRNALNREMRREVQAAFHDVETNRDVWICIVDAEGDVFCSGKDLLETVDPAADDGLVLSNDDLFLYQRNVYKPFILAADGPCLAQGAGFALSSDIVVMTERASIGWPQVRRGISSVSGPSQGLHALPWQAGMGFLLRGKFISAQDAFRFGICNEITSKEDLLPCAYRWAAEILGSAPLAVQAIKEAGRRTQDLALEPRMRFARDIANRVLQTDDAREGIAAFREKRRPQWKGR
ncbi:MAG TPA: enoyl-CoA hydratase-related protein [Casimicrobiaceae bacterium]|nr:enoyl-CoA hydratase-related protein [Casimicrobiaceae bacterium]